jgi:hypothetical protein
MHTILNSTGILVSDMAYGVVRQGFDPGLQVFFVVSSRECVPAVGSAFQSRLRPSLFTRLDARAEPSTAPKWVSDCHS